MVKRADLVVYRSVRDMLDGSFAGGDMVLGLKEEALALAPLGGDADPAITGEARAAAWRDVQALRDAIVSGRIAVPATPEELSRFAPPPAESLGLVHAVARRP
jgi:basic membrane lipoprotein Med (substrate-binding protein (PBP1-ABC) superfamily)